MSSMTIGGYKSVDVVHPRGEYQEPFVVTAPIFDHRDGGHYVRPNKVALQYPDFKKDANQDANVRVFNFIIKKNEETFEEYIINAFSYMLRDMALDWCHNYMLEFLDCIYTSILQMSSEDLE
jgi:hypothetical protein